jgi:hypothetical protein
VELSELSQNEEDAQKEKEETRTNKQTKLAASR